MDVVDCGGGVVEQITGTARVGALYFGREGGVGGQGRGVAVAGCGHGVRTGRRILVVGEGEGSAVTTPEDFPRNSDNIELTGAMS